MQENGWISMADINQIKSNRPFVKQINCGWTDAIYAEK